MRSSFFRSRANDLARRCGYAAAASAAVLFVASPAFCAAPSVAPGSSVSTISDDAQFARLVDSFVDEYAGVYPTTATNLGLHEHDGDLEDLSPAGMTKKISWLTEWDRRLSAQKGERLSPANRFDLAVVRQAIGEQLFSAKEGRSHRRYPGVYLHLAADSVNQIMKRDYAPAEVRLRSVCQRLSRIPSLLLNAESNLDEVAPVSIDITLSDLEATIHFFQTDVPTAFPMVKDAAAQAELKKGCAATADSLRRFGDFLRRRRPSANAPFALGRELFQKKLWAEEMIDEPIESLLQRSEAELHRLQTEFRAAAERIDAHKPAATIQLDMQKDHPVPEKIIAETATRLKNQQKFILDKGLVSLPSRGVPEVKETPPFMRATSLASMDAAGPFERSQEAYYYVTLPEPTWQAAQTEDFMRGAYNRPLIDVVNIHEAFPGHFVQNLWLGKLSKARKVFGTNSNIEGWAHYSEQMMLDENYGSGDPRLRLAQLQDALLRASRFVVAIRMHTQGMSVAAAGDFFVRDGFQARKVAEMEALRGTQDPLYLVYTYGKLEIFRLRKELQAKRGAAFSLRGFHDEFLSYGQAPLRLIRDAMLNGR